MAMKKLHTVKYIAVHCSATQAKSDIGKKEIDVWHRKRKMFSIGYHYVIRRNGEIEEGRERTTMGAHVRGFNHNSIGICMIGGVDSKGKPENNYEPVQFVALKQLLNFLKTENPDAEILGHKDFPGVAKACPCFEVKEWVDKNL